MDMDIDEDVLYPWKLSHQY